MNDHAETDALRASHIEGLRHRWQTVLADNNLDGVWLDAGAQHTYFADDHGPRFKPNAYFAQWIEPEYIFPDSKLFIDHSGNVTLYMPQPDDYWHATAPVPEHLSTWIDIQTFASVTQCTRACQARTGNFAYYGELRDGDNLALGRALPDQALAFLDFHRAVKSDYELALMREASRTGVQGHIAAAQAFHNESTEFEIHMAFLSASAQTDMDVPYGNIIALNQHAAILHYQWQARHHTDPPLSLLIDAGAQCRGYASDITRTYAREGAEHAEFQNLLELMQTHQTALLDGVRLGRTFADLHADMHTNLAQVLVAADLVTVDAETALDARLTEIFCPHGLGHLLGLQVHDAGGHLANAQGDTAPPPTNYPTLRFTREIECNQVFTIEPGLYFIASLLDPLRGKDSGINWTTVDRLSNYGGIRIEDNVRVLQTGVENLTRNAWAEACDA